MKKIKGNWKTTVVGFITGLIPIGHEILNTLSSGQMPDWRNIGIGIGIMILGKMSKDHDVSGGTRPIK